MMNKYYGCRLKYPDRWFLFTKTLLTWIEDAQVSVVRPSISYRYWTVGHLARFLSRATTEGMQHTPGQVSGVFIVRPAWAITIG